MSNLPEWICELLSKPRLSRYLEAADEDVDALVRLYRWNLEISAAFYAPLHFLELGVRNSMHTQLAARYGTPTWWSVAPIDENAQRIVAQAERKVATRLAGRHTPDDVVAKLSFGFWVSLLSRGDAYDRTLWVPFLHRAFPLYKGPRGRLHADLKPMSEFRNQVMHHEPIHDLDLHAYHAGIYRLLGYVSPGGVQELKAIDRVAEVLQRRGAEEVPGA